MGADPDTQDKKGRTPVMLAAEQGHDGIVTLLAQNCADFTLQDAEGRGEQRRLSLIDFIRLCFSLTHLKRSIHVPDVKESIENTQCKFTDTRLYLSFTFSVIRHRKHF